MEALSIMASVIIFLLMCVKVFPFIKWFEQASKDNSVDSSRHKQRGRSAPNKSRDVK